MTKFKSFAPYFLSCLAVLFFTVGWGPAMAFGQLMLEVQTFDTAESTAAAGWAGSLNGPGDPQQNVDFHWQDSNYAGGAAAGEAGGLMPWRSEMVRYYADTTVGNLDQSMALHAEGKLTLQLDQSYGGQIMIGWFDQNVENVVPLDFPTYGIVPDSVAVSILPNESSLTGHPLIYNILATVGASRGGGDNRPSIILESIPPFENYVYDFVMDYDPNGFGTAMGKLTVTFTEVGNPTNTVTATNETTYSSWPSTIPPWNGEMFDLNAFGLFAADDDVHAHGAEPYIDDLQYTVSSAGPLIPPDFDNSGFWDLPDLNLVLFNWQQDEASLPDEWVNERPATVGLDSLNLALFNWQQASNSLAVVPEPAAGSLLLVLALCGITMIRGGRRGS